MNASGAEGLAPLPVARTVARDLPRISPLVRRWFVAYLHRYFARNFDAVRVSREAPVLVVRRERTEHRLGGAANAAANLAGWHDLNLPSLFGWGGGNNSLSIPAGSNRGLVH